MVKFLTKKNYEFFESFIEKYLNIYEYIDIKFIMNYVDKKYIKASFKKKQRLVLIMIKKINQEKLDKKLNFNENTNITNDEEEKKFNEYTQELNNNFSKKMKEEEKNLIKKTYEANVFKEFDDNFEKMKKENDITLFNNPNYFSNENMFADVPEHIKKYLEKLEVEKIFKKYYILIDSRQRNHDIYNNNDYFVELNTEYTNIFSIKLKQINLPNSDYIINSSNNYFYVEESTNEKIKINISEGNYTLNELLIETETQLNNLLDSNYTVSNSTHSILNDKYLGETSLINATGTEPWKVFDINQSTYWFSNTVVNDFIYKLPENNIVSRYSFKSNSFTIGRPITWTIEISNDLNNWTVIDTKINEVYSPGYNVDFNIPGNTTSARYVRLNITDTSNSTDMHINELSFYKDDLTKIDIYSDLSGGDNIFNLYFDNSGIKNVFGFKYLEYNNNSKYISENPINLHNFNNNIYMYLNNYSNIESNDYEEDLFCIIPMRSEKNKYTTFLPEVNGDFIYYPEWKTSLTKLNIKYYRYDSSLYNFNGKEHDMLLEIKILNIN